MSFLHAFGSETPLGGCSYRVTIGLLSCFNSLRESVLLAVQHVLAAVDQIAGGIADCAALADQVIASFRSFVLNQFARLRARLRREQNPGSYSEPQPQEEEGQLVVIGHGFLFSVLCENVLLDHRIPA